MVMSNAPTPAALLPLY